MFGIKNNEPQNQETNELETRPEYQGSQEYAEIGDEPERQEQENVLELKFPIMVNGEEVVQLEYDFDNLTAKDLHETSKYLKGIGISVGFSAMDYDYQLVVFAKAVKKKMRGVALNDLMRLKAADAMKATALTRNFLLDMDPGQKELGSGE